MKLGNDFAKLKGPPILCIDFDGVIHSYKSGWKGPRKIPDQPVDGAIEWIRKLLGCPENIGIGPRYLDFKIMIYSSRSRYIGGRRAMRKWLIKNGLDKYEVELIKFPNKKPPAFLQIDDRAITFNGIFPTVEEMKAFKPWNKIIEPPEYNCTCPFDGTVDYQCPEHGLKNEPDRSGEPF